jgi:hypothetical protein
MDEEELGPVEALRLRAMLHVRGGKRRLRQGKIAAGVATLYDALSAAMRWYVASPQRRGALAMRPGDDLDDDRSLHAALVRSGVLDGRFDFDSFRRVVEHALEKDPSGHEQAAALAGYEAVMTQLGVMPFDEASLPPEDPGTY